MYVRCEGKWRGHLLHSQILSVRLLNCNNNQWTSLLPSVPHRRGEHLSPLSLLVDAGADTHAAQLPAGEASLRWFGHKTKGTIVGLVLCEHVEILPLSLPVVSIRLSWRNTFNPVQDYRGSPALRRVAGTLTCLSVSPQLYIDFVRSDQRGIPHHLQSACNTGCSIVLPLCWVHHRRLKFRIQLAGVHCSNTVEQTKRRHERHFSRRG